MKSLTLNSLIIVLFFASYVFAGGFEEDPGPEELVSESNNSTSNTDSLSIELSLIHISEPTRPY